MQIPLPPDEYMRLVCGTHHADVAANFERVGADLVMRLRSLQMVNAGATVLDVGCGCGRLARQLLALPIASYTGFDRHPGMIAWAAAHLIDPRFIFLHVDVISGYSVEDGEVGTIPPTAFVFPFPNNTFTDIIAASVLTHINLVDGESYLHQMARVLIPGGKIFCTVALTPTTIEHSPWDAGYSLEDLQAAIARSGLRIVTTKNTTTKRQFWFCATK